MNTNNSSYNDRQGQSREIDQVVQVHNRITIHLIQ